MMLNLTPHAKAAHPATRFVGMLWAEDFTCWDTVRAVQYEVFGRTLPELPVGKDLDDRTATLLALRAGWSRNADWPEREGDVMTMVGPAGLHIGAIVDGRVLHNLGGKNADGRIWGNVRLNSVTELSQLCFGHMELWRSRT